MNVLPWLISDCEVALWAAWKDGMPMHGPGAGRGRREPLFVGHSSLAITETFDDSAPTGHGWTGAEPIRSSSYQISASFPDGAVADAFGQLLSGMHAGGFRILTVRFQDEMSGVWTHLSFFYVTPASDAASESGQVMTRAVTLKASWKQERVGGSAMPALDPVVFGEVDWICGPLRVTALNYDPASETWSSLPRNHVGDGVSRYVTLTPATADSGSDVILAAYLPRVSPADVSGDMLPTAAVKWQNTVIAIIGNHDSANHHGLMLRADHAVQANGTVEPLVMIPQSRALDEPVIVFRYLRRVYATIGHGVLAVPRLLENQDPPVSHDPAFRLAIPGPANPATGQSGLTLLPNGGWLDGTIMIHP